MKKDVPKVSAQSDTGYFPLVTGQTEQHMRDLAAITSHHLQCILTRDAQLLRHRKHKGHSSTSSNRTEAKVE